MCGFVVKRVCGGIEGNVKGASEGVGCDCKVGGLQWVCRGCSEGVYRAADVVKGCVGAL